MPYISRIRLCNIGPRDARIDDIILDLRGHNHSATDTAFWLRNGGGKTTLVHLIFALVYPDLRKLLTGRGDFGERHIEEYIKSNGCASVVIEWELDSLFRGIDSTATSTLLTGVIYERVTESNEDQLRRLFFMSRSLPSELKLTLEGLPFYVDHEGVNHRRTMASFKQEWQDLNEKYPIAEMKETENIQGWIRILEGAKIDPTLFYYQILMNRREGGAEDIFKFKDVDRFVNFFLELTFPPDRAQQIKQNVEKFRTQYAENIRRLQPELELAYGLISPLTSLSNLKQSRFNLDKHIWETSQQLYNLQAVLSDQISQNSQQIEQFEQQIVATNELIVQKRSELLYHRHQSVKLRYLSYFSELSKQQDVLKQKQLRLKELEKEEILWRSIQILNDIREKEQQIRSIEAQLRQVHTESAPLLQQLQDCATQYVSRLKFQADQLQKNIQTLESHISEYRQQRQSDLDHQKTVLEKIGTIKEKIEQIQSNINQLIHIRNQLESYGILLPDESWNAARQRLEDLHNTYVQKQHQILNSISFLTQKYNEYTLQMNDIQKQANQLDQQILLGESQIKQAQTEYLEVAQNPKLLQYLQVEFLHIDTLIDGNISHIYTVESMLDRRINHLIVEISNISQIIQFIEKFSLFPPNPDVCRIIEVLSSQDFVVWSGWSYVNENFSDTEIMNIIQLMPEVVSGIVVQDASFKKVCDELEHHRRELHSTITVASQQSLNAKNLKEQSIHMIDTVRTFSPESNALFNKQAAQDILETYISQLTNHQDEITNLQTEITNLRTIISHIKHLQHKYPRGWFIQQELEMRQSKDLLIQYQEDINNITAQQKSTSEEIESSQKNQESLHQSLIRISRHQSRLDATIECMPYDLTDLEEQIHQITPERDHLSQKADKLELNIKTLEERIQDQENTRSTTYNTLQQILERTHKPSHYADKERISPQPGDINVFEQEYLYLCQKYENSIDSSREMGMLTILRDEVDKRRQEFSLKIEGSFEEHIVQDQINILHSKGTNINNIFLDQCTTSIREKYKSIMMDIAQLQAQINQIQLDISDAKQQCLELGLPEPHLWLDDVAAFENPLQGAIEADNLAISVEHTIDNDTKSLKLLNEQLITLSNTSSEFQKLSRDLDHIFELFSSIIKPVEIITTDITSKDQTVTYITSLIDDIRKEFIHHQSEQKQINDQRKFTILEANNWVDHEKFETFSFRWARQIRQRTDDDYEYDSDFLLDQVRERIQNLEQLRQDMEKDKDLIVRTLESAATQTGMRILRSAAARSKFPSNLRFFGGRPFMQIQLNDVNEQEERHRRIDQLITKVLSEGILPTGMEIVQQAVRILAAPINVSILAPKSNHVEYIPIVNIGKLSGGERLTCAVLLYCTLAKLRAHERGQSAGSSPLILDNPIGTSSRRQFLTLQLAVARAMNIQLVYTTGVNDFEAIRVFPRIIKLRNERFNKITDDQMLELATSENTADSEITNVHLLFQDIDWNQFEAESEGSS